MKIAAWRIFGLVCVGFLVAACVGVSPQAAGEPVEITFYKRGYTEGGTDITSVTNAKAVEMFQKRYPNITVKIVGVPWSTDGDKIMEDALESGQDINVFSVRPSDLIRLSKEGKVSNLEPFLTPEDRADFYPNALQAATVDGKIYAWPIWVVVFSIFANTDMFAERGVDLPSIENPWTWDEFLAATEQLTYQRNDGSKVYGFTAPSVWWTMQNYPFFYIDGGRIFSPDGKRFVQNQPEALSGLQKIVDLYQKYQVTRPGTDTVSQADAQAQFKNEEAAMFMSMPAFITELEEEDFPVAVLPLPTGQLGQLVTTGAFGMYGVYNSDDPAKLKASHEFARYITGSQVAKDVPGYQLAPGFRRSNTGYATSTNRKIITQLVEFGIFEAPVSMSVELTERYRDMLRAVATGSKSPRDAMDEIAPLFQQEIEAARQ